jgi:hypothetical protein
MKFNAWKNATTIESSLKARDIDAAVDRYMAVNGEVACDCISDHITLLVYQSGVMAIVEDGYAPDAEDFSPKP